MTAQDQLIEVAMRELARRHANRLRALGPVQVLSLDPCPCCGGNVVASPSRAACTDCYWRYPGDGVEPLGSRRADP